MVTNEDGHITQNVVYIPYGEVFVEERNGSWASPYLFNAKELDEETGLYYYGARYLNPSIALWLSTDPLQEKYPGMSPYNYCAGNPVKLVDPDGRSTDITDNGDGSYTVINAYNDKDCNIYVVDSKGNRTGELFGKTLQPFDFLSTEDDGSFSYKTGETNVTFSYDDLWLTGSFPDDQKEMINYNNMDASDFISFGNALYRNNVNEKSPKTFYGELQILAEMSKNYAILDFKTSLGRHPYTPVFVGESDGLPVITTLRAVGNITFGVNMKSSQPWYLSEMFYYKNVMEKVGLYNQSQNNGTGYNMGFPYYGEHTYSGSYIYLGYFQKMYK